MFQGQPSDAVYARAMDHFECLYEESAERPKTWRSPATRISPARRIAFATSNARFVAIMQRPGVVVWSGFQILDWHRQQTN